MESIQQREFLLKKMEEFSEMNSQVSELKKKKTAFRAQEIESQVGFFSHTYLASIEIISSTTLEPLLITTSSTHFSAPHSTSADKLSLYM